MTKHFQKEIERLKKRILHLAATVEEALQLSVQSVSEHRHELAHRVIDGDAAIDSLEIDVEEDCLKILALHQPVAADLRYVIAVLKINNDLERIGDLAVNIAERSLQLTQVGGVTVSYDLRPMLETTVKMVQKSVDALVSEDAGLAQEVCLDDDRVDEYHKAAYQTIQAELKSHPDLVHHCVSMLGVSKNLERIADHATNIAEDVIYMIDGEIVRHRFPEEE